MAVLIRNSNFRSVTIGLMSAPPPPPYLFFDDFTGPPTPLDGHIPDIGNPWIPGGDGPGASTDGPPGNSLISDDPNIRDSSCYFTALTQTGSDIEVEFFLNAENSPTDEGSVEMVLMDTDNPQSPGSKFRATILTRREFGPSLTEQIFSVYIDDVLEYEFVISDVSYPTNTIYKMVISGTTVSSYIGGSLLDTGTVPVFTVGPSVMKFCIGAKASIPSVSVIINDGVPTPSNNPTPTANVFLDTFTGSVELLEDHTPDLGNAWIYDSVGSSVTASTTGAGTMVTDDGSGTAVYTTALTHTGTELEVSFFLNYNPSSNQQLSLALTKGTAPGVFDIFLLDMDAFISIGGESGTTTGLSFHLSINDVNIGSYAASAVPFVTGAEYKVILSSTTMSCYVAGVLIDLWSVPVFTEGPHSLLIDARKTASLSTVALNITDPTPI